MKANIAVVTTSGKHYYLIVSELKKRNVFFMSLTPYDPIPLEIDVVISTEKERPLIKHHRILVALDEKHVEALVSEALRIVEGKEHFEKFTVGIDPGELFGLAVLADGKVIETDNCFSVEETLARVVKVVNDIEGKHLSSISVKIGDGVPRYKEHMLHLLDEALPSNISLESVSESGTSQSLNGSKHRRGLRDIISAIQIAGRPGCRFQRRKSDGQDG
jgi:hypothetical protein